MAAGAVVGEVLACRSEVAPPTAVTGFLRPLYVGGVSQPRMNSAAAGFEPRRARVARSRRGLGPTSMAPVTTRTNRNSNQAANLQRALHLVGLPAYWGSVAAGGTFTCMRAAGARLGPREHQLSAVRGPSAGSRWRDRLARPAMVIGAPRALRRGQSAWTRNCDRWSANSIHVTRPQHCRHRAATRHPRGPSDPPSSTRMGAP